MKKFKFRMQVVLEQRERMETVAKLSLAEAEIALQRGEILLTELRDVRAALLEELCARRTGAFDPLETRIYQEYLQTITQSIREQENYVRDLATTKETHKLLCVSAAQNREVMARFRDRERQTYQLLRARAEQGEIDELATVRYNHQQRDQE